MASPLIINGITCPDPTQDGGKYSCYEEELGATYRMVDGSLKKEIAGYVTVIEYEFPYFDEPDRNKLLAALKSVDELQVVYLDYNTNTMKSGLFSCRSHPRPTLIIAEDGGTSGDTVLPDVFYQTGYSVVLEGVYSHD